MVRTMLEADSGRTIDRSMSFEEAVAHGAAIYAGMLVAKAGGEPPRVSVRNVNSHDLGVLGIEPGTNRPRRKVLIPRNTVLPATHSSHFVTHVKGQKTVSVPVIEGGDASGNNSAAIGKCVVRSLPKGLPKGTSVVVNFTYADNGRLTVSATLPELENAGATMTIQRATGLSDEQVQHWRERIDQGLKLAAQADENDAETPEDASDAPAAPPRRKVKARPLPRADEDAEDATENGEEDAAEANAEANADGNLLDLDATIYASEDTVEETAATLDFLSQLGDKPSDPPPKKAPPPSPPKKGATPPADDEKADPDDDDALGNFLKGLG